MHLLYLKKDALIEMKSNLAVTAYTVSGEADNSA